MKNCVSSALVSDVKEDNLDYKWARIVNGTWSGLYNQPLFGEYSFAVEKR